MWPLGTKGADMWPLRGTRRTLRCIRVLEIAHSIEHVWHIRKKKEENFRQQKVLGNEDLTGKRYVLEGEALEN